MGNFIFLKDILYITFCLPSEEEDSAIYIQCSVIPSHSLFGKDIRLYIHKICKNILCIILKAYSERFSGPRGPKGQCG